MTFFFRLFVLLFFQKLRNGKLVLKCLNNCLKSLHFSFTVMLIVFINSKIIFEIESVKSKFSKNLRSSKFLKTKILYSWHVLLTNKFRGRKSTITTTTTVETNINTTIVRNITGRNESKLFFYHCCFVAVVFIKSATILLNTFFFLFVCCSFNCLALFTITRLLCTLSDLNPVDVRRT